MTYLYYVLPAAAGIYIYYCPDLDVAGESDKYNYPHAAGQAIKEAALNNFIKKGLPLPPASSVNDVASKMDDFLARKYKYIALTKFACECFVPSTPEA